MKTTSKDGNGSIVERILFPLYTFIFIFSTVNREFLFFGIDLRFILFAFSLLLIALSFMPSEKEKSKTLNKSNDSTYKVILIFFIWCLLSNISWLWSNHIMLPSQWINQNILLMNNLLVLFICHKYRHYINAEYVRRCMIFSCIVLVISFLLTLSGFRLDEISGSDIRSMSVSTSATDNNNIYGGDFRLAGYAEDANYASILLVLGIIAVLQIKKNRLFTKIALTTVFLIALGFSCSRTVFVSIAAGVVYVAVYNFLKKDHIKKIANTTIIILLFILSVVFLHLKVLSSMDTMATRYHFWNISEQTFMQSPIIGSGIGSARSAINEYNNGSWYVQPHSNYWQIAVETGAIGIILFIVLSSKCLNNKNANNFDRFMIFVMILFGFTFEIIQLQMFVYVMYISSIHRSTKRELVANE